ncbi:ImmA/IrrE family metallo-endopeptidase [Desulfotalea psychrophila]|nr:ImmA/IrrE family metallo-endopeptidase [Desulfotalea psychrophila]
MTASLEDLTDKISDVSPIELLNILSKEHDLPRVIPIDVEKIASILGIKISRSLDPDFCEDENISLYDVGCISYKNRQPLIWLNPLEHTYKTRERFTLAHEIGHYIKHILPSPDQKIFVDTGKSISRSKSYGNTLEFEANKFAAILLMPRSLVQKQAERIRDEEDTITNSCLIEKLATIFDVSIQSMTYRFKNLDL